MLWIINKKQPKFGAIFFSKTNPDVHVSTKINTLTFYKGEGCGAKKCKKREAFTLNITC